RLTRGLSTAAAASALWPALGAASVANVVVTRDDPTRSPGWSPGREEDGGNPEPTGAARQRVDRRQLDSAFVAPASTLELAVTAAFEAVLGVEGMGLQDDFFALGGDSLSATQVVARLRERFAVDLPIAALLDGRTPEAVAAAIEGTLIEEAEQVEA